MHDKADTGHMTEGTATFMENRLSPAIIQGEETRKGEGGNSGSTETERILDNFTRL